MTTDLTYQVYVLQILDGKLSIRFRVGVCV